MPSLSSRTVSLAAILALAGLALLGSWRAVAALDLPTGANDFNIVRWELRNFPNKWLFMAGSLFHSRPDTLEEKDRLLVRFLDLNARIDEIENDPAAADELAALRDERDRLENTVEWILEERVTAQAEDLDLEMSLPLIGARLVFPPVDFEFAEPPRVLAVSPRDRIELRTSRLLRSDLTAAEAADIESMREAGGDLSALVVGVGGIGAYPTIVPPSADYQRTLELVAHEWLHNYLFFKPLGSRYFDSNELRTLNETVASIAGREMAALAVERHPLPEDVHALSAPAPPPTASVNVDATLRSLRLDVERLLDEGRIEEAEALMEATRRYLVGHGYRIRRLNQAYFAFHGLYGDDAASIDPIGPKMQELRDRSPSLGAFIRAAADLRSESDLDRLLESPR